MKTKYALKAMIALAKAHETGAMLLIADLAKNERIPRKFLETILLELKYGGFLQSKAGRNGGYTLRRSPPEIKVGQIIRLFEGPLALLPCASQTGYKKCADCEDDAHCGLRLLLVDVRDATALILDHTTLAQVLERAAKSRETDASTMMFNI